MSRLKDSTLASLSLLLALAVQSQACNDKNDNDRPPTPVVGGGGKSSTSDGGSNAKPDDTAGKTSDTPSEGGTGAGEQGGAPADIGGEGGGGDVPPTPTCNLDERGKDGCYNCPKDGVVPEWLNRCADVDQLPFPNRDRLPKLKSDGSVPDLP